MIPGCQAWKGSDLAINVVELWLVVKFVVVKTH